MKLLEVWTYEFCGSCRRIHRRSYECEMKRKGARLGDRRRPRARARHRWVVVGVEHVRRYIERGPLAGTHGRYPRQVWAKVLR